MKYDVIITAAGNGSRSALPYNKIFLPINNIPCIIYSVQTFLADADMEHIYITIQPADETQIQEVLEQYQIDTQRITFIYGGKTRQASVYAALKFVKGYKVLIHDGARPFVKQPEIDKLKQVLTFEKAAILAQQATDTLKEVDTFKQINRTINREKIYYAQTPQAFEVDELLKAHEQALAEDFEATDDAQLMEVFSKYRVQIVVGTKHNIKITTPDDIALAELLAKLEEK